MEHRGEGKKHWQFFKDVIVWEAESLGVHGGGREEDPGKSKGA
jgi:hypothetical protein